MIGTAHKQVSIVRKGKICRLERRFEQRQRLFRPIVDHPHTRGSDPRLAVLPVEVEGPFVMMLRQLEIRTAFEHPLLQQLERRLASRCVVGVASRSLDPGRRNRFSQAAREEPDLGMLRKLLARFLQMIVQPSEIVCAGERGRVRDIPVSGDPFVLALGLPALDRPADVYAP
jgi:hypothetical protein